MPFPPLTNFEKQKYFQNEPKFNSVYLRNDLPKIKDGAYIKNLDEYESIKTYWIASYVNIDNITYSDGFGIILQHIPNVFQHILTYKKNIGNKNIITNIYRIQANN